jgi:shikimate dehydrogenase
VKIDKDTTFCMSLAARPGNFGTRFHNYLYEKLNLNFVYKAFTTTDIGAAVGGIRALGIRGCAISMPFKEVCMPLLDEIEKSALGIQSVNTIVNDSGRLIGSNTDYIAVRDLLIANEIPSSASFALFGSGGMAKAVACALKDLGFSKGTVISRNQKSGEALARQYGFAWSSSLTMMADLLINTSPIGMKGAPEESLSPFTAEFVSRARAVFDVVAMPIETPLIKMAEAEGKQIVTGFEVQALQALEQFVLYTGARPGRDLAIAAAHFARM